MDEPFLNLPSDVTAIQESVKTILLYQKRKKLSNAELLKKFTSLGTDRTWLRLRNGDLRELDAAKWVENCRTVVNIIGIEDERADRKEPLYGNLSAAVQLESAFIDAMNETGNARFILMLGDTGTGKSSAKDVLIEQFGDRILWVEASAVWRDRSNALLGAILKTLGNDSPPKDAVLRLDLAVGKLRERRIMMIIDEGQHLGPECLNTLKTLINNTPGEFGVLAMKTLWERLQKEAYQEARQLTGNRLAAQIDLALCADDITKILKSRVVWEPGVNLAKFADLIMPRSANKGNLALVREIAKAVNDMRSGSPASEVMFKEALSLKGGNK